MRNYSSSLKTQATHKSVSPSRSSSQPINSNAQHG
jgi:hypothetical protein